MENVGEIIGITIILLLVLSLLYFVAHKAMMHNKFVQLNQERDLNDLEEFYIIFEEKGYSRLWISQVVHELNKICKINGQFIPKPSDSFRKDYHWKINFARKYSSYQMQLVGETLGAFASSLKEEDWNEFQEKNGEIDTFDDLFQYLEMKLNK